MIIARLAGGIGNQMFHYAVARNNQRSALEPILLDTRMLRPLETDIEKLVQRPFALGVFPNLKATVIDPELADMLGSMRLSTRIRRQIFKLSTQRIRQTFLEPIDFERKSSKKNLWLEGNFQSERYFHWIREALLSDFAFPGLDEQNEAVRTRMLASPHALSIHIRRGDYLSSANRSIFDSVMIDYYRVALEQLAASVPLSEVRAFVFSDDIPWARANFAPPGLRVEFIDGNTASDGWKDVCLMSCCRHHIIANSSFSWWGAWLSVRGGAKFAPRHWFRPGTYAYAIEHIVPESWQVIDYTLN